MPRKSPLFREPGTSDCKNPPYWRILGGGCEFKISTKINSARSRTSKRFAAGKTLTLGRFTRPKVVQSPAGVQRTHSIAEDEARLASLPRKSKLFRGPGTSDCKNPPYWRILGGGCEFCFAKNKPGTVCGTRFINMERKTRLDSLPCPGKARFSGDPVPLIAKIRPTGGFWVEVASSALQKTNLVPCVVPGSKYGAEDEARTRYLHLGKVALYQMSYSRGNKNYYNSFPANVKVFFTTFLDFYPLSSSASVSLTATAV